MITKRQLKRHLRLLTIELHDLRQRNNRAFDAIDACIGQPPKFQKGDVIGPYTITRLEQYGAKTKTNGDKVVTYYYNTVDMHGVINTIDEGKLLEVQKHGEDLMDDIMSSLYLVDQELFTHKTDTHEQKNDATHNVVEKTNRENLRSEQEQRGGTQPEEHKDELPPTHDE